MNVSEFRSKIRQDSLLVIEGKEFKIEEVVRFRFDDGSFYIKCFLSDGYVFADDLSTDMFLLVKGVRTDIDPPFPDELDFDSRKLKFLYTAHAVAEEIWGKEIFKKGDSERFWDFKADDGSYLSLGINDETKERMDFYGKIIPNDQISFNSDLKE